MQYYAIVAAIAVSSSIAAVTFKLIYNAYAPASFKKPMNFKTYKFTADEGSVARFTRGLTYQTVSRERNVQNMKALDDLKNYILESYPLIHNSKKVKHEVINSNSLLYIIQGSNKTLDPAVLIAHLDVVPTEGQNWNTDPFKPAESDGYIYARGTMDDKCQVFAILEAAEALLKEDHQFQRELIIAIGHDEEVGGYNGARRISERLTDLGYKHFEFTLDEGLMIVKNPFPGIKGLFAMIGTSQKGYANVNLSIEHSGGHSSMPTRESAISILGAAVHRIQATPFPNMMGTGPEVGFLQNLARHMPFFKRIVLSNSWLFGSLIDKFLSARPATNAFVRTTAAVTQFHAGIKVNVLAPTACASVNIRVHPGQTVAEAVTHLRSIIADDRVKVDVSAVSEAIKASQSHGAFGYDLMEGTIKQIYPNATVTEGLLVAKTDSNWYMKFTDNIYLFNAIVIDLADTARIHGRNERIATKSYQNLIEFYYRMIRNMNEFASGRQNYSHDTEL